MAAAHLDTVLGDESLPWHGQLSVQVLDSKHSIQAYLHAAAQHEDLVTIARMRSNCVFCQRYQASPDKRCPGAPRSYGEPPRFALREPETWQATDEYFETTYTSKRGHVYTLKMQGWHNILMRGKRTYPMREKALHTRARCLVR